MKVIILSNNFLPFVGGIEIVTDFAARILVLEGYEVCVITWNRNNEEETLPYTVLRNPSIFSLVNRFRWADLILENNPCLKLSWPNLFFRKPLLIVVHTWLFKDGDSSIWNAKLKKYWLSHANIVLAVSDALKQKCGSNTVVIENPYRAEIFQIKNGSNRNLDFVFLGRLVSDKGADLAIRALYELKKRNKNFKLTIIGSGEEEKNLKDLVKTLDLLDHVCFKGQLLGEELALVLNEHKYILVPSIWEEPFGMVAIEGMACGCIPIVARSGGLPEAVGDAGLLFHKNNLDDLVATIENVVNNPSLQQNLRNERNKHLKKYHSEIVAKKYVFYINNLSLIKRGQ